MILRLDNIVSDYCGIRRPWIGSTSNPLYDKFKFNTGIDVLGSYVYAYASGTVVAVGKDEDNYYAITIQYDVFSCLRYTHLDSVEVKAGDVVQQGFYLGKAHKYLHFEYITKAESMWPVRVGTETYYKHNPDMMVVK